MDQKYDLIVTNGITIIDPQSSSLKYAGGASELKVSAMMLRNPSSKDPYHPELQYLAALKELVDKADAAPRADRTGVGTFSVFGRQFRFPIDLYYPLLTTKLVNFKAMFAELAWMLRGETNINTLDAKIWDEWADENGDLGPVYGKQWRAWSTIQRYESDDDADKLFDRHTRGGFIPDKHLKPPIKSGYFHTQIDQLANIIEQLKTNPTSRRLVVSAWNVADLPEMRLSPCHCLFQFYVDDDGKLDLQLYQRSADIFLGVPFNIASYALLLKLVAAEVGRQPGTFIHTFGDLHLYTNHVEQAREQLSRNPRAFPELIVRPGFKLFDLKPDDVALIGYDPHEPLRAPVAV